MKFTSLGIFCALAQSLIYVVYDLVGKRLREEGASALDLTYLMRLALWPALITLALSWNTGVAMQMLHSPAQYGPLLGFVGTWLVYQWVYFRNLNIARSLAVVSVTRNAIGLPLLMVSGFFINHDVPTLWGYCAVGCIVLGAFVRPRPAQQHTRQYLETIQIIVWLTIAYIVLVTVKDSFYRLYLQNERALIFGISVYMILCSLGLYFFSWIRPRQSTHTVPPRWVAAFVSIWVIGTVPEGIAFGMVPVYTLVTIGTVSWIITIGSDLHYGRLSVSSRTACFIGFVLAGITCAMIEHY